MAARAEKTAGAPPAEVKHRVRPLVDEAPLPAVHDVNQLLFPVVNRGAGT